MTFEHGQKNCYWKEIDNRYKTNDLHNSVFVYDYQYSENSYQF